MEDRMNITIASTSVEGFVKPERRIVAYYRVSTIRQGESGLGLEAQRAAVAGYARANQFALIAEYTEIETAKRDDLANRPELRKAIAHAKRSKAVLVVAKLDRLVRSVHVTSLLHQGGIDFIACDNPNANRLTIQILAAVAEHEAKAIGERTKAALGAYKLRGGLLGSNLPQCRNLDLSARRKGAQNAGAAHRANADAAYADIIDNLQELRRAGLSLQAIAKALNDDGQSTRRGKDWNPMQVSRILGRGEAARFAGAGGAQFGAA
jgi:DNA invertase Pin-like site-specific DNA recombinase